MLGVGCPKGNARPALSNKKANTMQKELNEAPNFQKGKKIKGLPFSKESKRRAWPPKRKGHEACSSKTKGNSRARPPKRQETKDQPFKKEGERRAGPSKRKETGLPSKKEGKRQQMRKERKRACLQKGRKSREYPSRRKANKGSANREGKRKPPRGQRKGRPTNVMHYHIASQSFVDFRVCSICRQHAHMVFMCAHRAHAI